MITEAKLPKKLDLTQPSFEANGKKYLIESTLSIERYAMYQDIEIESGFGMSFKDLFNNQKKAYELLNQGKMADAAVLLYNNMQGFAKLEQKEPFILKYCALFINEEHEDRTIISEDMITNKIQDWRKEGYEIQPFFTLAMSSIVGYTEALKNNTLNTLQKK